MSPLTKMLFDIEIRGKKSGMIQGEQEGLKNGLLSVAKKMLEKNMKIEEIQELTGLSRNEIEKLILV